MEYLHGRTFCIMSAQLMIDHLITHLKVNTGVHREYINQK